MGEVKSRRAIVTEEHRAESLKLKAIWHRTEDDRRARGVFSQEAFGAEYNIGNQAAVGFFLNGKAPISLKAATGFAIGLRCKVADFSPRWAAKIAQGAGGAADDLEAEAVALLRSASEPERVQAIKALRGMLASGGAAPSEARAVKKVGPDFLASLEDGLSNEPRKPAKKRASSSSRADASASREPKRKT